jgi:hypothetical protein
VSNQLTSFLRQSSGDGWCAVRCSVHLLTKRGFTHVLNDIRHSGKTPRYFWCQTKQWLSVMALTSARFLQRHRYANAKNTLEELLDHGVLPILNENDTTSVEVCIVYPYPRVSNNPIPDIMLQPSRLN